MQGPTNTTDPKVTVVQTAEEIADFPQIPGYRILRRLGQGGMATVYLATQESLDRPVSIKVMAFNALTDETSKQRFENEARTIAKLDHPSIVSIYEVGRTGDGRMYYIMPYLSNGDLSHRELSNDEPKIVEIVRALLSALEFAHGRGIVHRDVKLENVLFDSANQPLLADFGIALSKEENVRITTAGLAVGSSGCMAPEQARGDAVDGRADLYSVGVMIYELLTGELPFRSSDAISLALMHAQKPIPRMPPAKRHWQAFIDRALAKSPDERFQTAQQMSAALDRIGRHTGNHLSGRVLRRLDAAQRGLGWKRPLLIVLGGIALVAGGMYFSHVRLNFTDRSAPLVVVVHDRNDTAKTPAAATSVAAAASSANAQTAKVDLAAAAVAIKQARDELAQGQLTAPTGKNAVDQALAAWELAPSTPDNKQLVADVLAAVSAHQLADISKGDDAHALDDGKKAQVLASSTIGAKDPAWRSFRDAAGKALAARAKKQVAASDNDGLAKTQALAGSLDLASAVASSTGNAATTSAPGTSPDNMSNAGNGVPAALLAKIGPNFVFLHGPVAGFPAAAIGRAPVTVHQYAEFVNATRRPASPCSSGKIFDFGNSRNWSSPGFTQEGSHPVVCVSWDDALAYAKWRSVRDGHRFRLASRAEWRMAVTAGDGANGSPQQGTVPANSGTPNAIGLVGLDGNVSEWLMDCARGCDRHMVAGRSWRDRGSDEPRGRDAAHGYDDTGFRLVEVLGKRGDGQADEGADGTAATPNAAADANANDKTPQTETAQPERGSLFRRLFGRKPKKKD